MDQLELIEKWVKENTVECLDAIRNKDGDLESWYGVPVIDADELFKFLQTLINKP